MEMETYNLHKAKAAKGKKKSTVQTLTSLFFRAIELTVVVVTVAKLFYQLVITFDNSGERFRGLAAILTNRHFVFFVGNAIVIAILAKHGRFPNQDQESDPRSRNNVLYEEFVRERRIEEDNYIYYSCDEIKNRGQQSKKQSIAAKRERQIVTKNEGVNLNKKIEKATDESVQRQGMSKNREKQSFVEMENRERQNRGKQRKSYVRSGSENFEKSKVSCGRLRRSETERTRDLNDGMSNDELRYKIESFIARQRRNQQDEEFCIS